MEDRWELRGLEYVNCNCAWGCPCQFNALSTHGFCEALAAGIIDSGHFNEVDLGGLRYVMLVKWPGEIAEGNGRCQFIVSESASSEQREAMLKILKGESTAPGATHFFVFNSTMSEVLEPIFAPIECEVNVQARTASVDVPGLVESTGSPIVDPNSGEQFRAGIALPNGFEYSHAEMGTASSKVRAGIELDFSDSYGQFNLLQMNQDGVIR